MSFIFRGTPIPVRILSLEKVPDRSSPIFPIYISATLQCSLLLPNSLVPCHRPFRCLAAYRRHRKSSIDGVVAP
ncbi:hypothetical protein TNCV_286801 [Trichonephila clavipes]|nr:hypothetical protein TNCV_286801 [Trichonephila clavipes]